jgi:hypothetical protein
MLLCCDIPESVKIAASTCARNTDMLVIIDQMHCALSTHVPLTLVAFKVQFIGKIPVLPLVGTLVVAKLTYHSYFSLRYSGCTTLCSVCIPFDIFLCPEIT